LAVFIAGVAASLAVCRQISLASEHPPVASIPYSDHDHHSDAHHEHSDSARFHCPSVDLFGPSAVFSANPDRGPDRAVSLIKWESALPIGDDRFHGPVHGPPAFARTSGVPSHLFLSVLLV
jgi:hypothetical protein